jgi:hypothetical protein
MVEDLPNKLQALSSNPNNTPKKVHSASVPSEDPPSFLLQCLYFPFSFNKLYYGFATKKKKKELNLTHTHKKKT